ncbi:MAG: ATPase, partial [Planctomycetes bacterium]|nr:ATPase [Planctomycetota bacterium]
MAQKGIRECDAKKLLDQHIGRLSNGRFSYSGKVALITPDKGIESAVRENPWIGTDKLVIKPDQLFGKRGKYGLILLNATYEESKKWIEEKLNSVITVGKTKGRLTHLLLEPFVEHDKEYYMAFTGYEGGDHIHFSTEGGVDIEANLDKVTTVDVPIDGKVEDADLSPLM